MGKKKKKSKKDKKVKSLIKQRKAEVINVLPEKKTIGISTIYRADFVRQVLELSQLGLTNKQMAHIFGVAEITFQKWVSTRKDFRDAMNEGKIMADAKVANMMYNTAVGYEVDTVKIMSNRVKDYDAEGNLISERTEALVVPYKKMIEPNFNAQKHWLGMRQKGLWKDSVDINANVNVNHKVNYDDFTDAELEMLQNLGQKQIDQHVEEVDYEDIL